MSRSIEEIEEAVARVASDLEDLREKRAVRLFQYGAKEDILCQEINKLEQRWIKRRPAFKPREYAEAIEKVQGKEQHIPGLVLRQQADLCQKFHLLETMEQEVDRLKDQNAEIIWYLNEQIKEANEENDKCELESMNKLCIAEAELNEVKEKYTCFMQKHGVDCCERSSLSTVNTISSLEDEGEEEVQPATTEGTTAIGRGIRSMFRLRRNNAPVPAVPVTPTQSARRRAVSKTFTSPTPRSKESSSFDRQRIIALVT